MYSYGPPHMAVQKQDDQHEHTFSSYVRIRDVVLKTYLGRWTIGRSGERGQGISGLPAWCDDDDDDDIYIYIDIYSTVNTFQFENVFIINSYSWAVDMLQTFRLLLEIFDGYVLDILIAKFALIECDIFLFISRMCVTKCLIRIFLSGKTIVNFLFVHK